ncbi:MAG TPA: hypothetical protein VG897_04720, partial [Terriglobales bacterium]|nr:hypothetical protein [Terriglobales bacterium]
AHRAYDRESISRVTDVEVGNENVEAPGSHDLYRFTNGSGTSALETVQIKNRGKRRTNGGFVVNKKNFDLLRHGDYLPIRVVGCS